MLRAAEAIAAMASIENDNGVITAAIIDNTLTRQRADKKLWHRVFQALWSGDDRETVYNTGEAEALRMAPADMATAVLFLAEIL